MEENENCITATPELSNKKIKKIVKNNNYLLKQKSRLTAKLECKTNALWFASEIIQEKVEPTKTVEQVYEMLKLVGKTKYLQKNPDKAQFLSNNTDI